MGEISQIFLMGSQEPLLLARLEQGLQTTRSYERKKGLSFESPLPSVALSEGWLIHY